MVRRAHRQRSVFEVLLPDGDKLWDPVLERIDAALDDEALVDLITAALAQRYPLSQRRGRARHSRRSGPPDAGPEAPLPEIGRASVGKECRSRWSPYH